MLWQRARPLLGTLVSIQVRAQDDRPLKHDEAHVHSAMDAAFDMMAHIGRVMSAHHPQSDLARLSCAAQASDVILDPHTVTVLVNAQHWRCASGGAFDPSVAAQRLSRQGLRPGLSYPSPSTRCGLTTLQVLSRKCVHIDQAVCLDLGGIAKGYAVDQAVEVLRQHGITSALVNAGGDMRAIGPHRWRLDVRHANQSARDLCIRDLRYLRNAALATSVAGIHNAEFVASMPLLRQSESWQSVTVRAKDCMTADALTKWALQSSRLCPSLNANLRRHGARMWRNK